MHNATAMTSTSSVGNPSVYIPARRLPRFSWDNSGLQAVQLFVILLLVIFLLLPMASILYKAFDSGAAGQSGVEYLVEILFSDRLLKLSLRSLWVGLMTTFIVVPLAYLFAYGLTRTLLPGKSLWRAASLLPLLAPSLLPGISLIYLFGNQGLLKSLLGGDTIYGFWGIVLGEAFYTFPHALMVLMTSLSVADARLYDAARAMGSGFFRTFFTVTFPSTSYGVFSAACLVFTLTVTDFGVPKVVGGDYSVLAIEAYKAVVGQQNFPRGAVIALLLLMPALLTFFVDRKLQKRQGGFVSSRAQPLVLQKEPFRDYLYLVLLTLISAILIGFVAISVWASFVKMWPYNLTLSLRSYDFDNMDGGGWLAWRNSVQMSFLTAVVGVAIVFIAAWVSGLHTIRGRLMKFAQKSIKTLALIPMAIPGMVLGLGYIFFFNQPGNPLGWMYGSMTLLVLCTVIHFYTSAHMTAVTAIRTLDPDFEAASASLKVSRFEMFYRITLPMVLPSAIDVARYLFVSGMTTVSAVVFIYSPKTVLAGVAVLNMDDAGAIGPAAAMCCVIMATSAVASIFLHAVSFVLVKRTQGWRRGTTGSI